MFIIDMPVAAESGVLSQIMMGLLTKGRPCKYSLLPHSFRQLLSAVANCSSNVEIANTEM